MKACIAPFLEAMQQRFYRHSLPSAPVNSLPRNDFPLLAISQSMISASLDNANCTANRLLQAATLTQLLLIVIVDPYYLIKHVQIRHPVQARRQHWRSSHVPLQPLRNSTTICYSTAFPTKFLHQIIRTSVSVVYATRYHMSFVRLMWIQKWNQRLSKCQKCTRNYTTYLETPCFHLFHYCKPTNALYWIFLECFLKVPTLVSVSFASQTAIPTTGRYMFYWKYVWKHSRLLLRSPASHVLLRYKFVYWNRRTVCKSLVRHLVLLAWCRRIHCYCILSAILL